MAERVIPALWSYFTFPVDAPRAAVCADFERALLNTPMDPWCSEGDGGTNCCLILSQGPLRLFFFDRWPNEPSLCSGADSLFQLMRPEIRFVQILKGLAQYHRRSLVQQKGMVELIAVCSWYRCPCAHFF